MCQAAISSYTHYLPSPQHSHPVGAVRVCILYRKIDSRLPSRHEAGRGTTGIHTNPQLSSEAAVCTPSEMSPHQGTLPFLPDKLCELEVLSVLLYLQYLACCLACLAQQRCSVNFFFFFPKENNPTKAQAGAPPCLRRPVSKALTHLDLSHPGDRSGRMSEDMVGVLPAGQEPP